jgi:indolepyruvate ferredoxin oxidoreductase beta subunit
MPEAFAEALAVFPDSLRPIVGEALTRLMDYQDERYATLYLERLGPFVGLGDPGLAGIVARHLALWMTYEDAIRVADLKTRAGRLARIRAEAGAADAEIVVTDYLKPDLEEIYGILPDRLVAPFARWAERRWPHGLPTMAQHVRTTSVLGFLRLWLLGRCRWLRPHSYRARRERERMERWLAAVRRSAEWSGELASEVARAGQLMKGYGDVRRRMAGLLDHLAQTVLQAAALELPRGAGVPAATQLAAMYRRLVLQGPEGETRASALATEVLAHLDKNDPDAALTLLKSAI